MKKTTLANGCLFIAAWAAACAPEAAWAQPEGKPAAKAPASAGSEEADRLWMQSWKEVARYYVTLDGRFYAFPDYSKNYPSTVMIGNRRVSEAMYAAAPSLSSLTQSYQSETGANKTRTLHKPAAEVQAALFCLPQVAVGDYGWIQSGVVARVVGAEEVVLDQVRLIDSDQLDQERQKYGNLINQDTTAFYAKVSAQPHSLFEGQGGGRWQVQERYRTIQNEASAWWFAERFKQVQAQWDFARFKFHVVGMKTDKMKEGARWPADGKGFQLAIFRVSEHSAYAVAGSLLEKGLSEADMAALLEKRGLSKSDFADCVKEAKKKDYKNWAPLVVEALERHRNIEADPKPAEAKPAEAKPVEIKPVEVKPADAKPVEPKPAEAKPGPPVGDKSRDVELGE